MRYYLSIFILILVAGCRTVQPPLVTKTTETITVTKVLRDTTVIVERDSASIQALFECDSLNQVVMTNLEIEKGRKVGPIVQWKDKLLTVTIPVDSEAVYLALQDRYEHVLRTDTVFVYPREPPSMGIKIGKRKIKLKHILITAAVLLFSAVLFRIIRK